MKVNGSPPPPPPGLSSSGENDIQVYKTGPQHTGCYLVKNFSGVNILPNLYVLVNSKQYSFPLSLTTPEKIFKNY